MRDDHDPDTAVYARRFSFDLDGGTGHRTINVEDLPKYARAVDLTDRTSDMEILVKVEESLSGIHLRGVPRVKKVYSEQKALVSWSHARG